MHAGRETSGVYDQSGFIVIHLPHVPHERGVVFYHENMVDGPCQPKNVPLLWWQPVKAEFRHFLPVD